MGRLPNHVAVTVAFAAAIARIFARRRAIRWADALEREAVLHPMRRYALPRARYLWWAMVRGLVVP